MYIIYKCGLPHRHECQERCDMCSVKILMMIIIITLVMIIIQFVVLFVVTLLLILLIIVSARNPVSLQP